MIIGLLSKEMFGDILWNFLDKCEVYNTLPNLIQLKHLHSADVHGSEAFFKEV